MINFAANKQFRPLAIIISLVLVFSMAISLAGITSEADCDDDCQIETGACCECICCPNKVLMTAYDENIAFSESGSFLWTIQRISLAGEQEWFIPIDHPPQNFS